MDEGYRVARASGANVHSFDAAVQRNHPATQLAELRSATAVPEGPSMRDQKSLELQVEFTHIDGSLLLDSHEWI
jgi:hypothetical protein